MGQGRFFTDDLVDADWTIVVADAATVRGSSNSASGHGSAVLIVPSGLLSGLSTFHITHNGKSNFVILTYGDSRDLTVNEIGHYGCEKVMPSSAVAIVIEADGDWTFTRT